MEQLTDVLEKPEVTQLQKPSELSVIASKINHGLEAFEKRKADLMALKKECEGLTIGSIDDKAAIEQVATFRKKLKTERVIIEKEGKSMRDPLTHISRTISGKENELIEIIEPTEKLLQAKENWVRQENERIAAEKEKAEQAWLQARVDKLAAYGYRVDLVLLRSITDGQFEGTLESARVEHEREVAKKVEEKRLAEQEAMRLQAEREELKKLRDQAAESQRIIDEQNAKIRGEQLAREAEMKAEQHRIAEERRAIEIQKQIEQAAKDLAEKKRLQAIADHEQLVIREEEKLAQASDKAKFRTVAATLISIKIPDMKSRKARALHQEVRQMIDKIVEHINSNI